MHSQTKLYLLVHLHESTVFLSVLAAFIETPETYFILHSPG